MLLLPQLLIGLLLALPFVLVARRGNARDERRLYAFALVGAALSYVGFAVWGGASAAWLALEAGGVALFTLLAALGLRVSGWVLVLGWAAHAGWDVLLHTLGNAHFVPEAYPLLCVGFDGFVAGYLARLLRLGATPRRG